MSSRTFLDGSRPQALKPSKHQRAHDHLYGQIVTGKLAPGEMLPTEEKLAESLSMSRQTVRQALSRLESEGVIRRIRGCGTFVTTEQQRASKQRLKVFALIAPKLEEGFYPSLVHGFEHASANCQHQVVVCNSGDDSRRQGDLILQLIDQAVGGVALVPVTTAETPAYHIRQLQLHHIPVVFCHRSVAAVTAPCVTWSGREVGMKAGQLLMRFGHQRIAALFSHIHPLILDYVDGLRSALGESGNVASEIETVEYDPSAAISSSEAPQAIKSALARLFDKPNRPTAFFCGNLPDAEQVYLQAEVFGLRIPRDLSLIYFGGASRDHGMAQQITCIAVDEHGVGAKAAELLSEMRDGKRPVSSDERIVFPVTVLPGETVGSVANL